MNDDKPMNWAIALFVFLVIFVVALLGWGFIEIIQWITSK